LACANQHRPWQLYQTVFLELLACQELAHSGRRKFRFKNKLLSLDATVIDLCATLLRLGEVSAYQRSHQAPVCRDHRRQNPRVEGSPEATRAAWCS
jgi:hypothetical protein